MRSQNFLNYPKPQFRSRSWKPVVGLSPISFTFLKLSVAKLVINYLAVESGESRIPLHFHLPIYRSLGVTKFCVYTTWYPVQTVQIHLLEHSRVKICHRGATSQRGWALARARIWFWDDLRKKYFFDFSDEILDFGSLWRPHGTSNGDVLILVVPLAVDEQL